MKSGTVVLLLLLLGATDALAVAEYDLTVRLEPARRRMRVEGRLSFAARDDLRVVLSKRMRNPRFEVVGLSGIVIRKVVSHQKGDNLVWTLQTNKPELHRARVTISFVYEGDGATTNQYHIGPDVSFASAFGTDWYPLVDASNDQGVGRLRFHIAPAHDAVATGRRIADRRTATARVIEYEVKHATYFAFAAGAFHLRERRDAPPLKAYLLNDRTNADRWLEGTARVVAALEEEFGAYPFEELSFVEIPRDVATAASFNAVALQGFILLNHRAFDVPDLSLLWEWLAHEIAHAWFPHYLSFGRPGGRYMEEAIAEYGALRVVEALGGADAARTFRISGYPPDPIYSAAAYFQLVDRGIDHPIGALQSLPGHRDLAYTKGFMFFHMLSRRVGREQFRESLRRTARAFPYQSLPWWKFLAEIARHADAELATFYDQWLHREGAPRWTFTWRNIDQGVEVTIRQESPAYTLDLPVRITLEGRRVIDTEVHLDSSEETHVIPTAGRATNVELDPDFHVLHRPTISSP